MALGGSLPQINLVIQAPFKVGVCSEYRVVPRQRRRNASQQVLESNKGRIVANRERGLPFRDIALSTGRKSTTVMRIWNQWVAEGHIEEYAGSSRPTMSNVTGQIYCEVGVAKPYNHITNHLSENGHVCNTLRIHSYDGKTFSEA
ncbi:hypothetical protein TNCV_2701681 [Trichonephila clavipes]|nr:hypothetical protein TNCV_2701681 [Trichonephila clavipes]